MKKIFFLLILAAICAGRASAQWAVIDAANLSQNIANYGELVAQLSKQAQQISNQVQQIQQMQDQLNRLGNMADFKSIIGFPQLKLDLNLPTKILNWSQSLATVNGSGLFGDSRGGIYQPVGSTFADFSGATVQRSPDTYKSAQSVTTQVDNFKDVQSDVYSRRAALTDSISQTTDALQAADTDAEEKKDEAILNAQYSELASLDSEVQMSAAEVQVKAAESSAMKDAQRTADAEARSTLAQQEVTKVSSTYKPIYDSVLQYVNETPFSP